MMHNWRDKLSTLATVRDSLATIALLVGALWAMFTFIATRQMEQAALNTIQLEQQVLPVINVQLQAEHWPTKQAGDTIRAEVTLTNQGQFKEILDLTQSPFRIYPVQFAPGEPTDNSNKQYGQLPIPTAPWRASTPDFPKRTTELQLLPGEQQRLIWLYQVPGPYLYYVEFSVPLSQTSNVQLRDTHTTRHQTEWFDGVFVEVTP